MNISKQSWHYKLLIKSRIVPKTTLFHYTYQVLIEVLIELLVYLFIILIVLFLFPFILGTIIGCVISFIFDFLTNSSILNFIIIYLIGLSSIGIFMLIYFNDKIKLTFEDD